MPTPKHIPTVVPEGARTGSIVCSVCGKWPGDWMQPGNHRIRYCKEHYQEWLSVPANAKFMADRQTARGFKRRNVGL